MLKANILVIDDENLYRSSLSRIIELEGYQVFQAENALKGLKILEQVKDIMLVISDVKLPDINGITLLEKIRKQYPVCEVILMTAYGTIHDGVNAMKLGAFDYITKGDGDEQIIVVIERAVEKATMHKRIVELENKLEVRYNFEKILGNSNIIKEALHLAHKVAETDSTVLLEGETGTGKELFAQSIHNAGSRRMKPFVAVNCSAFPKELLESEMFGHRKGSFTGANYDKKGLFEEANDGTLFLDEIADMNIDLQAKLLRVLEEQTFNRIGDTKPIRTNVRIIAATNLDLLKEIQKEHFRADLYYRLSAFKIHIPSLRNRKEDIKALAEHFLSIFAAKVRKKITAMDEEFINKLTAYNWPGNTRELKNIIERSVILADKEILTAELLPTDIIVHEIDNISETYINTLEEIEKIHIKKILAITKGNKTQAAKILNIGIPTLYRKMELYGIKL